MNLLTDLENFNDSSRDRRLLVDAQLRLRHAKQLDQSHPVVQALARILCPYAMKLILEQWAQANQYKTVTAANLVSCSTFSLYRLVVLAPDSSLLLPSLGFLRRMSKMRWGSSTSRLILMTSSPTL